MPFPPPKPGAKQWAAGGATPAPAPHPAAPPPPPAAPAAPGQVNPQMVQRATVAINTIVQGAGLPQEVMDLLTQAQQHLAAAAQGGAPPPAPAPGAPPAGGPPPAAPPPKPGFPPAH